MVTWQLMTSLPSSKHWRPVGLAQDWILVGECLATAGCYGPMVFLDRLRRLHWCWTEPLLQSTIVCVGDLTANTSWKSCLTFTLKASSPIYSLHFFQFYSHWDSSWWVFADKYNFRCLLETKHLLRCFQCSSVLPPRRTDACFCGGSQEDADWSLDLCYWHLTDDWLGPTGFTL